MTDDLRCAGAPCDVDGNLRETINDCPFEPQYICLGLQADDQGMPMQIMALSCLIHRAPLMDLVAEHFPEDAGWYEIAALPLVLEHLGPDIWMLKHSTAA